MGKFTDAEGNEVEAFTQADVDKMLKDKADVDAKTAADAKAAADAAEAEKGKDKPSPLDEALERIAKLEGSLSQSRIREYGSKYAGNDPEKLKQFSESFNRLSGYDDNDTGFEMRSAAAARLAFGTDASVDVGSLSGAGTRSVDGAKGKVATPEDKVIREALGITEADVTKFGGDKK